MAKFYSKRDSNEHPQEPRESGLHTSTTYIGKSLKIKGNINSNEPFTIEGQIKGNIKSSEQITIGKSGQFNGEITAKTVRILGKAQGEITASYKLEICREGEFEGNLRSKRLVIKEGAIFNGTSTMEELSSFPGQTAPKGPENPKKRKY